MEESEERSTIHWKRNVLIGIGLGLAVLGGLLLAIRLVGE